MSELVLLVEALQRRRTRWASLSGNPRGSAASVLPWDPRGAPEPLADPPWLGSRRLVRCSHQNDAFVPLSSWYFSRIVNVLVKCQGSPFFLRRGGDAHVRQSRAVGRNPSHEPGEAPCSCGIVSTFSAVLCDRVRQVTVSTIVDGSSEAGTAPAAVLIIDDDEKLLALARLALSKHGVRVETVTTATAGLATLREF